MLKSNISACHLKLEDWKAAVEAANASIECLERVLPSKPKKATKTENKETHVAAGDKDDQAVVELQDHEKDDEEEQLKKLVENDAKREDVMRIRAKALMRRGRGKMELGGWANLQGADEDYKELLQLKVLPPQDERAVRAKLVELAPRINAAREKEMAEMMGKLKDVGSSFEYPAEARLTVRISLLTERRFAD